MDKSHFFVCHNLLSLYKSIAFAENNTIINDSYFIYLQYNAILPSEISDVLFKNIAGKIIIYEGKISEKYIFHNWKIYVNTILSCIRNHFKQEGQLFLHIYLDMWAFMPTIIEKVKKEYGDQASIYMHEEGYAMYTKRNRKRVSKFFMKYILHKMNGLSTYGLSTYSHGGHPLLDRIYCSNPEEARHAGKKEGIEIFNEGQLFSDKNTKAFMNYCNMDGELIKRKLQTFDYVFISQPIYDEVGEEQFSVFIKKLFATLSTDKVLIKLHPRDRFDYRNYISKNVEVLDELTNAIPFECLYPCIDSATILTFNSSCCGNITPKKKSLFMYRLIQNSDYVSECDAIEYDSNKIKIVNSFEEVNTYR